MAKAKKEEKKVVKGPDVATGPLVKDPKPVDLKPKDEPMAKGGETVSVSRVALETMVKELKDAKEDISMLKEVSNKGRIAQFLDKNRDEIIHTATIGLWEGKPMLGWKMTKDEVYFDPVARRVIENQQIEFYVDSGTKGADGKSKVEVVKSEYLHWYRNMGRVRGSIVKESKTATGETRTIELEDGRQYEMDIRFINP